MPRLCRTEGGANHAVRFAALVVSIASPHPCRRIPEALDRAEIGMVFADALHLGATAQCEAMLTFDRQFIEMAEGATIKVTER